MDFGRRILVFSSIGLLSFVFSGCGGSPTATQMVISWNANHESAVNSPGGGYRVYYSTAPGVDTSRAAYLEVPYVSGSQAPTSVTFSDPPAATYYFRVVAYSTFLPPTGNSIRNSPDSAEVSVQFP